MRQNIRKALIFGSQAIWLSACASGVTLTESAPTVSALEGDESRLVFYRTQVMGAAVQPKISVNGSETDTCQPNKVFFVDVPPGRNRVTAQTENKEELTVEIGPGQTAYIECTINFGLFVGRVDLKFVPEATGKAEVGSLAFSGLYEVGT